ncbi:MULTISPECIES: TonB-dependent receptor [unclassified Roseateles]|uniref:TonB-dependent receptor n=1 Tax=unclassified Roseateles TaxID=2626991 RepID=UPI000ADF1317|nr:MULTISPECIES: TonB-dependent receptor [unclassified Roseateles]
MKRRPALHPLAASMLLSVGYAHAQVVEPPAQAASAPKADKAEKAEKAPSDRSKLDTVIVTASKREEAAHKLAINIEALSENKLREENITDLKSLIAASPGIEAPANGARFTDSVTVRGLNVSSVSANNIEWFTRSTLSYYLDDTPLPDIGLRIKDVARVETLLGPQGTLYGGGALGGTVRYITNRPKTDRVQARLSTSFYQTRGGGVSNDTDGMVNMPLGDDLALRFSFARLDEKGRTDRYACTPSYLASSPWKAKSDAGQCVYKDDDWVKTNTGRLALLWKATPDLSFTVSYAQQSQLAHGSTGAQLLPATGNPGRYIAQMAFDNQTVLSPYPEFTDRDIEVATLEIDWKLAGARLHSATSSYSDSRVGQGDYLGTGSFFYGDLGYSRFRLGSASWAGNTAYMTYDNQYRGTVHETRVVSDPGVWSWVAGLYLSDQKRSQQYSEWMPGLEQLKTPGRGRTDEGYTENQASNYRETALFGEIHWKGIDRLTLTAGARMFGYKDRADTQVEDYAFDLVTGNVQNQEKTSGKSYYKLNAAYQLTNDLLTYATFSQGFRRGGANGFRAQAGQQVDPATRRYLPDSTDNLELGIKGFLLDRTVYVQANVYRLNWKDPQTYFSQDVNGFPVWGTTNGPKAYSQGVELQGRWRVISDLELTAATTYSEAKWDGSKTVCLYANATECRTYEKGGELGGSAPWKHTLGVRWSGGTDNGLDWWVALNARHIANKASDRGDAPGETVFSYPAYTTLALRGGLSFGDWDFSGWVNNLTDTRPLVSFQGTSAVAQRVGLRAIYLTPRTVGLSASYRFR